MARCSRMILVSGFMALGLLPGMRAEALTITPGSALLLGTTNTNSTITPAEWATTFGYNPGSPLPALLYKSDFQSGSGAGVDEGTYASSYNTTFSNSLTDPSNALIQYVGGPSFSCPNCFLVVKDGSVGNPAQYLFSLGNWDGKEDIVLEGFWPAQGAISHVAFYQGVVSTPEPATVVLLAITLACFIMPLRRLAV